MADAATIGGSVIGAGIIALAPKAIALVQTWIARRSDVAIEAIKADAREETASHKARTAELGVTERIILDRAAELRAQANKQDAERDDHVECREQVAALVVKVDACEEKHALMERAREEDRSAMAWMRSRIDRLERMTFPPAHGEPAE